MTTNTPLSAICLKYERTCAPLDFRGPAAHHRNYPTRKRHGGYTGALLFEPALTALRHDSAVRTTQWIVRPETDEHLWNLIFDLLSNGVTENNPELQR